LPFFAVGRKVTAVENLKRVTMLNLKLKGTEQDWTGLSPEQRETAREISREDGWTWIMESMEV